MTDQDRKTTVSGVAALLAVVTSGYMLVNNLIADPKVVAAGVTNELLTAKVRISDNVELIRANRAYIQSEADAIKAVARSTDIKVARVEEALDAIRDAQKEDRVLLMQIIRDMPRQ